MLHDSWLANLVREYICPKWECSSLICSILSAPVIGVCSPISKPIPLPPQLIHQLVNCRGQGFWSHDKGEDASLDQIPLMAPMANIFWQKARYPISDPGPNWLICVEISWDSKKTWKENIESAANFFIRCQNIYGPRLIAGTIWEEPDLDENYDPMAIDARIQAIRERMSYLNQHLTFLIGPNLSCAIGLGNIGIAQIRAKGLPAAAGIIWLEGYPMIAGNYELYVVPALAEVCHLLYPDQKIGYVAGIWQSDEHQLEPGYEEIACHWRAWNGGALNRWADRVVAYIYYRWRTDPGAGDCYKAIDQLPLVKGAIREAAIMTDWRASG